MPKLLTLLAVISLGTPAFSQNTARGTLLDYADSARVPYANILHLASGRTTQANSAGQFTIKAGRFDTLLISASGFFPDTVLVDDDFFAAGVDIFIRENPMLLSEVTVLSDRYRGDSLEMRERYNEITKSRTRMLQQYRGQGFGVTLNPFDYFSKEEKQKRGYLRRAKIEEQAGYVDYRFSRPKVSRLTGLEGDSLHAFMLKHRPSYEFCAKASELDMIQYINDRYVLFKKEED